MEVHEIQPVVEGILLRAVAVSRERASSAETANAITGALGLLHRAVGDELGYAAQKSFEDLLRSNLGSLRETAMLDAGEVMEINLPRETVRSSRADAILRDAVQSCSLVNSVGPGNAAIELAGGGLVALLAQELEGFPVWADLVDAIAEREDAAVAMAQATPGSLRMQ